MIIEKPKPYRSNNISFDYPKEEWMKNYYWDLRKEVFCDEQHVFEESDRDDIDEYGLPIVAMADDMGLIHTVVGVVRIDERSPREWWGTRLCVDKDYRTLSKFHANFLFDSDFYNPVFTMSIGSALIFKAVSTANYMGCDRFFAQVQIQNVKFFSRLYWNSIQTIELHGRPHMLMEADLTHYPPVAWSDKAKEILQ
jgi:hypothetical protein